jgi:uncharacterized protein
MPAGERKPRPDTAPGDEAPRSARARVQTSVLRGLFGAGQGVILPAVMELVMAEPLQQINALKNVLQAVDNAASALLFVAIADIDWLVVAMFAGGAVACGQLVARLGRRLPSFLLRAAIVVIGIAGFSILADGSRLSIQKIDQARALGSNTRIVIA